MNSPRNESPEYSSFLNTVRPCIHVCNNLQPECDEMVMTRVKEEEAVVVNMVTEPVEVIVVVDASVCAGRNEINL